MTDRTPNKVYWEENNIYDIVSKYLKYILSGNIEKMPQHAKNTKHRKKIKN